jgi:type I restriction enzyme R subunit
LTLSLCTQDGAYATNGTPEKFWAKWTEKFENDVDEQQYRVELHELKNQPLTTEQKDKLFGDRFRYVRQYFDDLETETIQSTVQDEYLYGLCRPERMLDLIFDYILYDNGQKKVARYQQFFCH